MHSSERTGTDFSAVKHQSHQPSSSIWCFSSELHIYDIEGISFSITLSPTLVDPALVLVIRAVDGQDTGLSAQPAEKNRLQTATDQDFHLQSALVQASLLLSISRPTSSKERDL